MPTSIPKVTVIDFPDGSSLHLDSRDVPEHDPALEEAVEIVRAECTRRLMALLGPESYPADDQERIARTSEHLQAMANKVHALDENTQALEKAAARKTIWQHLRETP